MARLRKKKLPLLRRLRSARNATMTRALPSTVTSTSSPMNAASSAAVASEKGPPRCPSPVQALPAARGLPEWLSHGKSWPMALGGYPHFSPHPAAAQRGYAPATAPPQPAPAEGGARHGVAGWGWRRTCRTCGVRSGWFLPVGSLTSSSWKLTQ